MSVRGGFSTPIIGITFMRRGERVACQSSLPSSLDKHRSINTNSLITGRLFIGEQEHVSNRCLPWFTSRFFGRSNPWRVRCFARITNKANTIAPYIDRDSKDCPNDFSKTRMIFNFIPGLYLSGNDFFLFSLSLSLFLSRS